MIWTTTYTRIKKYLQTGANQYGARFKQVDSKRISIGHISCNRADLNGLHNLVLLSDTLNVPVRYNFEGEQEAYIEVVSYEVLQECI